MRDKIKVLFLAADPFRDKARLELGEEMRAIDHAIQRGTARERLEFVSHFATRPYDIQYALLRHEPQVVHFAGHAGQSGVIYLDDGRGGRAAVDKAALGRLFGLLDGGVRVVVLNGCHTAPVAAVLSTVVDYAIGTLDRITDDSAIQFADAFYRALAFGKEVPRAFELAVSQLEVDGNPEFRLPVLRTRPGAAPGPLLAVSAPREADDPAGGVVRQKGRFGEIQGERVDIIAEDHQGPGAPAGSVEQDLHVRHIRGTGPVSIIGRRTGGGSVD